ncbi:MAG TPA: ATP-binding cassette domain-containing protein [Thermoanaerobaculia bacterium]|nr:ATP-binding cassette domain-containing protein [Thermoanaerobaculia bacterium]
MTSTQPILSVRGIRKTFGSVRAVDDVSFEVPKGTITGLLGRNGAGKTTSIRMITGILVPDEGSVEWHGGRPEGTEFWDDIGYLPEERGLYRQMKVLEHLLFLAEIKGCRPRAVRSRAEEWLRRFDLFENRDARIEELSKGNQQKVQLIGTLLHEPELVILDEPMSGLDPVNVVLVRNIIRELQENGTTVLLSTHMMGEAEKLASQIVLIHHGQVVLSGALGEIRESARTNHVHFEFDGDGQFLSTLDGVQRGTVHASSAELLLDTRTDPQAILGAAAARLKIRKFEIAAPSLEEIFIERVGGTVTSDETAAPAEVMS